MARFIPFASWRRAAVVADVDAEIQSHLEQRVRQLIDSGLAPDEARAKALQMFGDVEATSRSMKASARRHAGRQRRRDQLGALIQDARYTLRQLRRAPALATTIVLMLGLGIGATATMFGIVDRLLLRAPSGVNDPQRLGRLYSSHLEGDNLAIDQDEVSWQRFSQLRDGARNVADVAAMGNMPLIIGRGDAMQRITGELVSANYWNVLRVRPALGRFFRADEDLPPDGSAVVVLAYSYWKTALGADSTVLGRQLDFGSKRFEVIGVAPEDFQGVRSGRVDVWLPSTAVQTSEASLPADWHTKNNFVWLGLVARLADGVAAGRAEAVLTAALARASMGGRIADTTVIQRARVAFGPLLEERGPKRGDSTRIATWLTAIAGIMLLLACSNVANLLLARAIHRRREISVRIALGVSRGRLFRQLLVEGLILAAAGALLGALIAVVGGRVFWAFLLPTVAASVHVFDGRVLAVAALASIAVGVLASLAPALYAVRQDVSTMIKASTHEGATRGVDLRILLLAGQCALSTALLLSAGVFIRSLQHARSTPLGFDAKALLTVRAERHDAAPLPGGMAVVYRQFAERLRQLPGVLNATTTVQIPFGISGSTTVSVPGVDSVRLASLGEIRMNPVGAHYFETMSTRILRGRALTSDDRNSSQRVMVVSDAMAKALWPGADALGQCVKVGAENPPCSMVVGVAEDIHQYEVRPESSLQYWFPESQNQGGNSGAFGVMVRVAGEPRSMIAPVRAVLQSMAPPATFVRVAAVHDAVDRVVRPWRMGALVLSVFGVLGLVIAGMGLYSALSYSVSQRAAELGLRMALGATPAGLVANVVGHGMRVMVSGAAVGLVAALAAGRSINALLLGVTNTDPLVATITVATLLMMTLLASALPAWRASRTDPASVLRGD